MIKLKVLIRIYKDDREWPPTSREDVIEKINAGELQADDWVWDENTGTWAPLCELFPEPFPTGGLAVKDSSSPGDSGTNEEDANQDEHLFLGDNQKRSLVRMVLKTMDTIIEPEEELLYVATQRKPIPDLTPEALALSNQRIFVFEKGHFKTLYDDFPLGSILNPKIKTGFFFSHIHFNAGAGELYGVRFIPKAQAKKFFNLLEAEIHEIRAKRKPQQNHLPVQQPSKNITPPSPQVSVPPDIEEHDHAVLHRLETLKQMLEEELITPEDYQIKKQNLLEQL